MEGGGGFEGGIGGGPPVPKASGKADVDSSGESSRSRIGRAACDGAARPMGDGTT